MNAVQIRFRTVRYTHAARCGYCQNVVRATASEMEIATTRMFIWQCPRCAQHIGVEQMKPAEKTERRIVTDEPGRRSRGRR